MMKKCLVVLLTMIVVLSLVLAVGCQQAPAGLDRLERLERQEHGAIRDSGSACP